VNYRPVPGQVDLPAVEREVLAFWREAKVFAASVERSRGGPLWVFYEGPPTANGMPGTHHVEARVFKDVFPRFRTMKGDHVPRKAGWDCHGLPVELAVEKELGFTRKGDIEAYGVAEFNARCRESVERHVDAFEAMTERMGYWVDMSDAYRTMDPEYVDSVWWSLKVVHERGLLVQDHRVAPWCPRCGTGLSDHELGQEGGYETVVDPSVYVRLPVTGGPLSDLGAALLVWTTTPWTLVSNTAVAVHPQVDYVAARTGDGEVLVVAEPLLATTLGEDAEVLRRFTGRELERTPYQRPFELVDFPADTAAHYVVLADYVTTDDGTGLVHQSPAFGADDLAVCRAYDLPVVNPVRPDGTFEETLELVGGQFFKHADRALVDDLAARGLLYRHVAYSHAYPHCWRCHTPLLYYAQPSWYVRTTAVKDALQRENERTTWLPRSIKHGRYGDWLANNVDWALSRKRYWGTPLPVWVCAAGHHTVVGSRAELGELAGRDLSALDPHRPYVDEVTLSCSECGEEARRVPEVIDAWYDSGAMPFAQWGYPHLPGSREAFERQYPAQFICEALDQTRGWFYTLMAIGTLVFDRTSYENVLCLGLILDEEGRKMSKHLGNVLEPMALMDRHGADALRWFMAASGSPWLPRRVGHATLQEVVRKVLLTYWNTAAFQSLYGRAADWEPLAAPAPAVPDRPALDRWALSELHRCVRGVDDALESFDTQRAGRLLAAYVEDLSNWYVRRSRRRFWAGDPAALATLHECLYMLTLLMAPLVPFVTERVWQDLVRPVWPNAAESVHLAAWPRVDDTLVDDDLAAHVALLRRLVELGRAARADSGVRTRQPLGRALVAAPGWEGLPKELRAELATELNVQTVETLSGGGSDLVDVSVKPNFRALGQRFGRRTPAVAAALGAADPPTVAADLRSGTATVSVDGEQLAVTPAEVIVTETPREGWAVSSAGGESLALDLDVTPELRRAGLAREVVRLVQEARKTLGLDVSDRIDLWWSAESTELATALREHADLVAGEVLATSYAEGAPDEALPAHRADDLDLRYWLRRAGGLPSAG
jgi:isoleucyl-tRNA synthetase